jgi:chromate transporter
MSKVDLLAFGGGYSSVPLMFHEVVNVNKWIDARTFMDGIVVGQVTPGPIVITATFVGYWLYGLPGSIIGTISVFLPSFLIVIGIVPYYDRVRGSAWFYRTMKGILSSFVGLLISVTIRFGMNVQWNLFLILLSAAALVALLRKVEIFWVVLAGVILSIIALHR